MTSGGPWVCYALALLVELYRAPSVEGSRLMRLNPSSTAGDLLALAMMTRVADLIAMRDLALDRLLHLRYHGRPLGTDLAATHLRAG